MVSKLCGVLILVLVSTVHGENDTRSNVAFVIDETISMGQEINQIKTRVQEIFNAVLKSKKSQIGNFILITFNDYEAEIDDTAEYVDDFSLKYINLKSVGRDPNDFSRELENINPDGGGYCPEPSLAGIIRAIEECNPNSFIYVFTDAAAKDYDKENIVKAMAIKKSIQITFLLTGDCEDFPSPDSIVYDNLAAATSGQVFHLQKDQISKIIDYIMSSIDNQKSTLITKPIQPGSNNIEIPVDNDMSDLIIAAGGKRNSKVNISVTDPRGNKAPTKELVNTDNAIVTAILNVTNGTYKAVIDCETDGTVVVKASVNIDFQYGFSGLIPKSIKNTRTRPVSGMESHLAIKLEILDEKVDAELKHVLILDNDQKILKEMSADILDKENKMYVTAPFIPPEGSFKVAIVAVNPATGERIVRIARTPVEAQTYPDTPGEIENKRPEVNIELGPKFNAKYGEPLILECKVSAHPKPEIVWKDKESGSVLKSSASILELPYDYISTMTVENVTKTSSYICEATSDAHVVSDTIAVETSKPTFIEIVEKPKDTTIEYKKGAEIYCKVNAWPSPTITWYRDGKQLTNDDNFKLSDDKMTLSVIKMSPELVGDYSCKASNDKDLEPSKFTINISGGEPPIIDKTIPRMNITEGNKADIPCSVMGGFPEPNISWEFKRKDTADFVPIVETKQKYHIDSADLKNAGVYRCKATNVVGEDTHEIEVVVECPPVIEKTVSKSKVLKNSPADIKCSILRGIPTPEIIWEFKRPRASEYVLLTEINQIIHKERVDIPDVGLYRCKASNKLGTDSHEIELMVENAPIVVVQKPEAVKVGDEVTLYCEVTGEPKPVVQWTKEGRNIVADMKYKIFRDNSLRFTASIEDKGVYTCEGSNDHGKDNKNVWLDVYGPLNIDPPKDSPLTPLAGSDVELLCNANGEPKPNIMWQFLSSDSKAPPETLSSTTSRLTLSKVDSSSGGYYICTASNTFESKSITYEVQVNAPVKIEKPEQTEINAVQYDWSVRIPCKAKGYPKPTVTWMVVVPDSVPAVLAPLPIGNGDFNMDSDDTLIVGWPGESQVYVCTASNNISSDSQSFTLNISPYPIPTGPVETIYVERGKTYTIKCNLTIDAYNPYTLKWFKDGTDLDQEDPNYRLISAKESDSGIYSCHKSTELFSETNHVKIVVGTRPIFINSNVPLEYSFSFKRSQELDCNAKGTPMPVMTWWHNNTKLPVNNMVHNLMMLADDYGNFRCEANNGFGTVTRTFDIKNGRGCQIDYTKKDVNKYHPLFESAKGKLNEYNNSDGIMTVPENSNLFRVCPDEYNKRVWCLNNVFMGSDGTQYKYEDLKCDTEPRPTIKLGRLYKACWPGSSSKLYSVGYNTNRRTSFSGLYDVCYDVRNKNSYFVKMQINPYASNIDIDSKNTYINELSSYKYDDMFHCDQQCCYAGKQMVTSRDLPLGVQKASFFNVNVLPQWNLCGKYQNWDEVNNRIKRLSRSTTCKLEVYSGDYYNPNKPGLPITYQRDKYNNIIKRSPYIWRVVQTVKPNPEDDPRKRETISRTPILGVAIITLNIPNLRAEAAKKYVFCNDICDRIDWLKNSQWRDVERGYTFCCNVWELAKEINKGLQRILSNKLLITQYIKGCPEA